MKLPRPAIQYHLEGDRSLGGATAAAGIPLLIEAARALGVSRSLASLGLYTKGRGGSEVRFGEALLALLAAGGECLSDVEMLRTDPGLIALLGRENFPDARRLGEFLKRFHDPAVGAGGVEGRAILPEETTSLAALGAVNQRLVHRVQELSPCKVATLDWDTQCIQADKQDAFFCYKGFPGYQPGAVLWAEQGLVLRDQFRAGNVPSGFGVKDFVTASIDALPPGVERIEFRGDSAAYDWSLLDELRDRGVYFAITADSTEDLRAKVQGLPEEQWKPLVRRDEHGTYARGESWAEVEYVSGSDTSRRRDPLRYIAIRYPLETRGGLSLPGQGDLGLPLDAEAFRRRFRVVATNRTERGDQILLWSGERCGSIERVFRVMNNEQAAARPPCGRFGANAAWYRFNVLLFNLTQALRLLVLPPELAGKSLKLLRLRLLQVAGRVVRGASRIWKLRVAAASPALRWLEECRRNLQALSEQRSSRPAPAPG